MNKTYKSILLTLLTGLSVASCDSYEAPAITSAPAVSIVARDTEFPASASTGFIRFKADGPVTVYTSNQWITATVEGDEIKVTCTQNSSLQSRTGSITVKCGDKTTEISIMQEGVIFQLSDGVENVSFGPGKSNTEVAFKSNSPVEVSSDSEWLTADITDGILTINVGDNISLDDRTGSLKLTSGDSENKLEVTQSGVSYPIYTRTEWYPGDARTYYNLDYPFDMDIEYSSTDPEMLTYQWDKAKKKLYIVTEKNETGHVRAGSFTYTIGPKSGSMWVHQCDFTKDLESEEYYLYYTNPADGKTYSTPAIISWNTYRRIELPDYNLKFRIDFSTLDHTISITGGKECGESDSYKIYTVLGSVNDSGETSTTWSTNASIKAIPMYEVDDKDNIGYTKIKFEDAGTYTQPLSRLILAAFSSTDLSDKTYVKDILIMDNPVLVRAHNVSGK